MNAPLETVPCLRRADLSDTLEAERIERFVAANDGSVFHRPAWLTAIARGTGNTALGLIVERNGRIAAWLPLSDVHSPIFGRALVSSGFGVGGGALAKRDEDAGILLTAAQELAIRHGAGTIELRGGRAGPGWQAVTGKHANFSADLQQDDDSQLTWITRRARAEVRKGLARDLTVSFGTDEEHRAGHYFVYARCVRNLGTPVFPRSLFDAVLDGLADNADIALVRSQGRPVSAVLSLYHNRTAMPFWGGGTSEGRRLHATERMYYELMCHARRRGCARFDYGRSKVGSGPYHFKKNWGFEPEPLTYWTWSPDGMKARNIDPTDSGYSARIALWKKLPLPLANVFGPVIARGLG